MELSSSMIKKVLLFSQTKYFLIFREMESSKKTSYISGKNFPSWRNKKKPTLKKFLIFQEIELSSPKLEKLLYFL